MTSQPLQMDTFLTSGMLTSPPPLISVAMAERIAHQQYGLTGKITLLSGERDKNFRVQSSSDAAWVMKFYNRCDDAITRDFQEQVLLHIAQRAPSLPVPRLIHTQSGDCEFVCYDEAGNPVYGVLITLLAGRTPEPADNSASLLSSLGNIMAQLDLAISDFSHPAQQRTILWDLMHTGRLLTATGYLPAGARRDWIMQFISHFTSQLLPQLNALRKQVIHNDLSGSNILLDRQHPATVSGILDFGDMVCAPLINEIATAASYYMQPDVRNPLTAVAQIVNGYQQRMPLQQQELMLLYELILARLTIRVLITEWRSVLFPENRDYILRHNPMAWALLDHFRTQPLTAGRDQLMALCC
ncbi:phosphotransferase [Erwiniaceae bacterium BAC15a-03b]|uniref:Hydroxylysine kinase n=1 Tax=Winslowiella arboricola TaxID=2978220 RepID=A0A9J6PN03_9GAMM|nr:phosphotransferase [Winslowiella arboricola]MCU5775461.1 phosphotransferase [Winslowiella arboricola]MCU5779689.1 phosphotransferase [Winslowiella arboricola]